MGFCGAFKKPLGNNWIWDEANIHWIIHTSNDKVTHFCYFIDSPGDQGISIILNGEESELKFFMDGKGNKV